MDALALEAAHYAAKKARLSPGQNESFMRHVADMVAASEGRDEAPDPENSLDASIDAALEFWIQLYFPPRRVH